MCSALAIDRVPIYERPAELLQNLIRFDTTNPPGNEAECIGYVNGLLADAGCQTAILARDPSRPNLLARLPGQGKAPPLLLYGHVDVVTAENQTWQHPPFAGEVADGYVWGRGALDMKGGVAMMVAAFLRAQATGLPLAGDVVLALVSDEESGGEYGARWLVQDHADLFRGIRYALGEFGGFTLWVGRQRFYPVMVTEKSLCLVKATVSGVGGHGSLPVHGGVAARLGQLLRQLDEHRLPPHVTPVACQMLEMMAAKLPFPAGFALRRLLNPMLTDRVLDLLGAQGEDFDALLHHTVNVTSIQAGDQIWGVPSQGTVELAASLLPGYRLEDLLAELQHLLGPDVQLAAENYQSAPDKADMGLFDTLATVLAEADPEGATVPLLFPSPTDGRHFAQLGIQTYGFLPMKFPPDFAFTEVPHAADERIPVEAVAFGTDAIYQVLKRYAG